MNDLALLQQFEPIVRYTQGEMFFPTAVDEYVARASLWMRTPDNKDQQIVPPGELTLDSLARYDETPSGHTLYMNLVDEPLSGLAYQRWHNRPKRDAFHSTGRLARVPLLFRIVDSFFDLTFLVRGQVPGGFAAAAQLKFEAMVQRDPRRVYYGRVVRAGSWIVLQYLFFFTMNDWRSTFDGVNDHEADWEQVFVYVYEGEQGQMEPRWVAYASHDFKGDDLRRRWDDPLLDKVGSHPVVYAGAGSHASYFERGEYLVGIEPEFLKPVDQFAARVRYIWYEQLGMGKQTLAEQAKSNRPLLSIPHVDFARGDGRSIGPGEAEAWTPVLISDDVPWVDRYRGLWGLDTRDFVGGERAPSGPKYNRDGSVRQSWFDPLGWAGMDKEVPPPELPRQVQSRIDEIEQRQTMLDEQIAEKQALARKLQIDTLALRNSEYGEALAAETATIADVERRALEAMQRARVTNTETLKALRSLQARTAIGETTAATSHLRNIHHPEPPLPPTGRIADFWAAISGAMVLLALVLLLYFQPPGWPFLLAGVLLAFGAIEAVTRRRLTNYLLTVTIILAIIASVILVIEFWQVIVMLAVVSVVIFMIVDNLRELRRG